MKKSAGPTPPHRKAAIRPPGADRRGSPLAAPGVLALLLLLVTLATYRSLPGHGFLNYDDTVYVTANEHVRAGLSWQSVRWAWTSFHEGNWYPLTLMSHMLDVDLFGLDPTGHHSMSLALHAANVLLLFVLVLRLTGAPRVSATIAGLFAVHPLNIESVAWISERKNLLSTFFWLIALIAYTSYLRRRDGRDYGVVVISFLMGLASKPMIVTLPLTLLILDWCAPEGRVLSTGPPAPLRWPALREKAPLLCASVASGVVTLWAQSAAGAMQGVVVYSPGLRLGNAVISCGWYLAKMFSPSSLSIFYPHPLRTLQWEHVALGAVVLLGVSFVAVRLSRSRPWFTAGWLWYLVTLAPVLGVIQVGAHAHADRYAYVPLIGVYAMVVGTIAMLSRTHARWIRGSVGGAGALVILALSIATSRQLVFWRSSESLFEHAVALDPDNVVARGNLGIALVEQGRVAEAIPHFRAAVLADPGSASAHLNLGTALAVLGRLDAAQEALADAIRLDPNDARASYNLGKLLADSGREALAVDRFREALRRDPGHRKARLGLGRALGKIGETREALQILSDAVESAPDDPEARVELAEVLIAAGRFDDADRQLVEAERGDAAEPTIRKRVERLRFKMRSATR